MESSTVTHSPRSAVDASEIAALRPKDATTSQARRRGVVLARMLFAADSLSAAAAAALAVTLLGHVSVADFVFVVCVTVLWPLAAFSIGLYRADQLATWASAVTEIPRGFVAVMLITWPLFGIAWAFQLGQEVTLTFLTVVGISAFTGVARTVVRAGLHRAPELRQRTLILGSGVVAGQVVEKLHNNVQFGLLPVGIVDDEVHDVGTPDLPWLGRFADLDTIIEAQGIDRVIIAFSKVSHEQLLESIRACRDAGVSVDVVPRLFEFLDGVRALDQVGGLPLLSIGAPILTSASVAAKRVLDAVGSLALIALFAPVMIATAIAIKIESRGPVFFRQPRAGRRNTSFELITQADTAEGRAGRFEMIRTAETQGANAIADIMIPRLLSARTIKTNPDLVGTVRAMIIHNPVETIVADLRAMAERPDSVPLLAQIAQPTLVLVGALDQGTPPSDALLMADRIPDAQVTVLPDAAHLSNLEKPEAFNQAVLSFLDRSIVIE